MAAPRFETTQKLIQNPHAKDPLVIPIVVVCNTPDEVLARNVERNSSLNFPWLKASEPHDGVAVMIGGGPSAADHIEDIKELQQAGATVFAMNGASKWARSHHIEVDYQVMSDAKHETHTLVDPHAMAHLFASQCDTVTVLAAVRGGRVPTIWHLETGEVEKSFKEIWKARNPELRRGGYVLIGGGATTGNSALCVAYAMGFRALHVFGYDSCHRNGESHAYRQAMNDLIPTVEVEWAGKTYTASVAMKAQAEKFQITAQALRQEGCSIRVYGEGLLQQMYNAPPHQLSERDKYRTIWQFDTYREIAPGEFAVPVIERHFSKPGPVIDFGCGTGRAALRLKEAGYDVMLVDFADNCRDDEALNLPFLEWDLSRPCPLRAPLGICCDVMEHIPTADVEAVIRNIMGSAQTVFFQISTVPDAMGELIHEKLHLTVQPHKWWRETFTRLGLHICWQEMRDDQSSFIVTKEITA